MVRGWLKTSAFFASQRKYLLAGSTPSGPFDWAPKYVILELKP
jgi:hypothetical protein